MEVAKLQLRSKKIHDHKSIPKTISQAMLPRASYLLPFLMKRWKSGLR